MEEGGRGHILNCGKTATNTYDYPWRSRVIRLIYIYIYIYMSMPFSCRSAIVANGKATNVVIC